MNSLIYSNKKESGGSSLYDNSRSARAFRSKKGKRYWILLTSFIALGLLASYGLLVYNNPVPVTSASFIPIVRRRLVAIVTMIISAICQSLATVAFQSVTTNKVVTPSLLGLRPFIQRLIRLQYSFWC